MDSCEKNIDYEAYYDFMMRTWLTISCEKLLPGLDKFSKINSVIVIKNKSDLSNDCWWNIKSMQRR